MKVAFMYIMLAITATQLFGAGEVSIRTMAVARTPESNTIALTIAVPQNGEVVGRPVYIQFRIDGYALGAASQFERASEIVETNMGQTVHVVVDDHPYFPINEPALDPFDEGGFYYDMSYKFEIPFRLKDGMHTIRMFPARSFGESLKGDNTFAAIQFYVGSESGQRTIDLSKPYITYNEPSDQMYLVENKPVLLDFYLSNAELSPNGYKVRVSIDGKAVQTVTSWQPFYIYGMKKGRHTVRLELLDSKDKLVPALSNDVKQTITIH
jgi:hypothetical protein